LGLGSTEGVALGDLNGDGHLDAFIANGYGAEYDQIWFNNGTGIFSDSGQQLGPTASKGVALGDLNSDGHLDAFVVNWLSPHKVYFNDGQGIFTESEQLLFTPAINSQGIVLADLNGDGHLDAFIGTEEQSANEIWFNDGTGNFTQSAQPFPITWTPKAAIGDLNGDGYLDIYMANEQMPDEVWFNDGTGFFTRSEQIFDNVNSSDVVLADIDGDGDLDAIVIGTYGPPKTIWLNNGSGIFTDSGQRLNDVFYAAHSRVIAGDLNKDGAIDLFFAQTEGANTVWFNTELIPLLPPRNLAARSGLSAVLLTWEPSQTGQIAGYHIYRRAQGAPDFTRLTTTPVTGLSYRDETATSNVVYTYYATSVDATGTESGSSNQVEGIFGQLSLSIPETYAVPGELVQVPVNVENADGLCIAAMDIGILYDDSVATAVNVHPTALTAGYTFVDTLRNPEEVHISSIGSCQPLYGPGSLFLVDFQLHPDANVDSNLDFVRGLTGTVIYDNSNLFSPVPLTLVDGALRLGGQYIRGDINGDGAVNAADAALALQISAGALIPTREQRLAGDVNGDGVINAADASMILHYAATQQWPAPPTATDLLARTSTNNDIYLTPSSVSGTAGAEIELPVRLSEAVAFAGGTMVVRYGDDLTYLSARLDGALETAGFQLSTNNPTPGETRLSWAGNTSFTAGNQEQLVWLRFRVTEAAEQDNTWVEVTGAWLNDVSGRDFNVSALQKNVYGGLGQVQLSHKSYLPLVTNP
jgi:hypothetical protein